LQCLVSDLGVHDFDVALAEMSEPIVQCVDVKFVVGFVVVVISAVNVRLLFFSIFFDVARTVLFDSVACRAR